MDSNNPTPLTPTTPTTLLAKRSSTFSNGVLQSLDPPILHILSGILRDLQFLNQQRYISDFALQEIIERLPKPTIPVLSPRSSPVPLPVPAPAPQVGSPVPSVHSEHSKVDVEVVHSESKNTSTIHEIQYLQSQSSTDSQQPLLSINDQQEHKPEIPDKEDLPTPIPEATTITPTPKYSMSRGPLPVPPNSINNTPPPHPTLPPNFISKQQEAEFYANQNKTPKIHDMLPAYSPQIVEAQWDFSGSDPGDLSFKKGDHIEVTEHVNDDWWRGRVKGKDTVGIFPRVYTKSLTQIVQPIRNANTHQRRTSTTSVSSISSRTQQNSLPTNRAQVPVQLQPQQPLNRQASPQASPYQMYQNPLASQPSSTYYLQSNQFYNQSMHSSSSSGSKNF
ncbi:SH3-domain-containing protein [Gigaspora margarita]|uniref:SH3-domain-containing protein n=1 Tax=Gigaspora margarita TaxID=4874 RepID=A0A8H4A9Y9_GIGMA|nr:SH3-domain-containing protein [Gigaspora margarita]